MRKPGPPAAAPAEPPLPAAPAIGLDQVLHIYEVFRDYLKHEDDLRSTRTGWLLTAQAFLFAAAATLVSGKSIRERGLYVLGSIAVLGLAMAINHGQRSRQQDKVYEALEGEYDDVVRRSAPAMQGGLGLDDLPALRYAGKKAQAGPGTAKPPYSVSYHTIFIAAWSLVLAFVAYMLAHRHKLF